MADRIERIGDRPGRSSLASDYLTALRANRVQDVSAHAVVAEERLAAVDTDAALDAADRIARMSLARSRTSELELEVEDDDDQTGEAEESELVTSMQAEKRLSHQLKAQKAAARLRIAESQRQAELFRHPDQGGASTGFGGSQQRKQLANFLRARGYEQLHEAGGDTDKVKAVLDSLAEAEVAPGAAASFYHFILSRYNRYNSDTALQVLSAQHQSVAARLAETVAAAAPAAPIRPFTPELRLGADTSRAAEDMPCYLTPVQ